MARKALKVKQRRMKNRLLQSLSTGKKAKYPTRVYNRCRLCGRNHGYIRKFDMCRICFRELASRGLITGVKKSSW